MITFLHNPAARKNQNPVRALDCGQAVGDGQGRSARCQLVQRLRHQVLALVVQRRRGLVQHHQLGRPQHHPGDADSLLLSARQLDAPLAHIGIIAVL